MSDVVQKERPGLKTLSRPRSTPQRPVATPQRPVAKPATKKELAIALLDAKQQTEQAAIKIHAAQSAQEQLKAQLEAAAAKKRLDALRETARSTLGKPKPISPPVKSTGPVSSAAASLEQRRLGMKIAALEHAIKETQTLILRLNPTDPMHNRKKSALQAKLRSQQAELSGLQNRLALAERNVVLKKPPVVRQPAIARPPLPKVPLTAPRPSKDDAKATLNMLVRYVPRLPGESKPRYRLRLLGLTQRALTRFQLFQSGSSQPGALPGEVSTPGKAIEDAVRQTVITDKPAVDAEASAGGLAEDTSTTSVESVVDEIADSIDSVVNATQDVPTVEQDLVDAEGDAGELLEEGEEPVDASAVPLYKRPVVIAAAAVAMFWLAKRQKWI